MSSLLVQNRKSFYYRAICGFVLITFLLSSLLPSGVSYAQIAPQAVLNLPAPGTMVSPSTAFNPATLKGIRLYPENPLMFDFMVHPGDEQFSDAQLREESTKLIKYFMAALTTPEDQMWVNLSPNEPDRIIADGFGATEMGRDLLAQDYLLKQLTASLLYPEDELGNEFWERVREKVSVQYGNIEIPTEMFNKVWIVPETASIYEHGNSVFVVQSRLRVMLEEDYVVSAAVDTKTPRHQTPPRLPARQGRTKDGQDFSPGVVPGVVGSLSPSVSEVIKEIILPEIEREVNTGSNFAKLRQIYNSVILAAWYKQNLKGGLIGRLYVDQNKTKGVELKDKGANQQIYNQYLQAFKQGVYDFIKEDYDPLTQEIIPRKYFSGGVDYAQLSEQVKLTSDAAALAEDLASAGTQNITVRFDPAADQAMSTVLSGQEGKVKAVELDLWEILQEVLEAESQHIPKSHLKITDGTEETVFESRGFEWESKRKILMRYSLGASIQSLVENALDAQKEGVVELEIQGDEDSILLSITNQGDIDYATLRARALELAREEQLYQSLGYIVNVSADYTQGENEYLTFLISPETIEQMADEDLLFILGLSTKGEKGKGNYGGAGMVLGYVKKRTEDMGGRVEIESGNGQTTVSLIFPRKADQAMVMDPVAKPPSDSQTPLETKTFTPEENRLINELWRSLQRGKRSVSMAIADNLNALFHEKQDGDFQLIRVGNHSELAEPLREYLRWIKASRSDHISRLAPHGVINYSLGNLRDHGNNYGAILVRERVIDGETIEFTLVLLDRGLGFFNTTEGRHIPIDEAVEWFVSFGRPENSGDGLPQMLNTVNDGELSIATVNQIDGESQAYYWEKGDLKERGLEDAPVDHGTKIVLQKRITLKPGMTGEKWKPASTRNASSKTDSAMLTLDGKSVSAWQADVMAGRLSLDDLRRLQGLIRGELTDINTRDAARAANNFGRQPNYDVFAMQNESALRTLQGVVTLAIRDMDKAMTAVEEESLKAKVKGIDHDLNKHMYIILNVWPEIEKRKILSPAVTEQIRTQVEHLRSAHRDLKRTLFRQNISYSDMVMSLIEFQESILGEAGSVTKIKQLLGNDSWGAVVARWIKRQFMRDSFKTDWIAMFLRGVNQLEKFSRGMLKDEVIMEDVDIVNIIRSFVQFNHRDQVRLTESYDDSIKSIKGDQEKITRIFLNLITNAYQAAGKKGEVDIRVYRSEDKHSVVVRISNNGTIPDDNLDKIFDPHFTTKRGGKGLGLSIVKGFVEAHNGSISVQSDSLEQRVTFEVILPVDMLANINSDAAMMQTPEERLEKFIRILMESHDPQEREKLLKVIRIIMAVHYQDYRYLIKEEIKEDDLDIPFFIENLPYIVDDFFEDMVEAPALIRDAPFINDERIEYEELFREMKKQAGLDGSVLGFTQDEEKQERAEYAGQIRRKFREALDEIVSPGYNRPVSEIADEAGELLQEYLASKVFRVIGLLSPTELDELHTTQLDLISALVDNMANELDSLHRSAGGSFTPQLMYIALWIYSLEPNQRFLFSLIKDMLGRKSELFENAAGITDVKSLVEAAAKAAKFGYDLNIDRNARILLDILSEAQPGEAVESEQRGDQAMTAEQAQMSVEIWMAFAIVVGVLAAKIMEKAPETGAGRVLSDINRLGQISGRLERFNVREQPVEKKAIEDGVYLSIKPEENHLVVYIQHLNRAGKTLDNDKTDRLQEGIVNVLGLIRSITGEGFDVGEVATERRDHLHQSLIIIHPSKNNPDSLETIRQSIFRWLKWVLQVPKERQKDQAVLSDALKVFLGDWIQSIYLPDIRLQPDRQGSVVHVEFFNERLKDYGPDAKAHILWLISEFASAFYLEDAKVIDGSEGIMATFRYPKYVDESFKLDAVTWWADHLTKFKYPLNGQKSFSDKERAQLQLAVARRVENYFQDRPLEQIPVHVITSRFYNQLPVIDRFLDDVYAIREEVVRPVLESLILNHTQLNREARLMSAMAVLLNYKQVDLAGNLYMTHTSDADRRKFLKRLREELDNVEPEHWVILEEWAADQAMGVDMPMLLMTIAITLSVAGLAGSIKLLLPSSNKKSIEKAPNDKILEAPASALPFASVIARMRDVLEIDVKRQAINLYYTIGHGSDERYILSKIARHLTSKIADDFGLQAIVGEHVPTGGSERYRHYNRVARKPGSDFVSLEELKTRINEWLDEAATLYEKAYEMIKASIPAEKHNLIQPEHVGVAVDLLQNGENFEARVAKRPGFDDPEFWTPENLRQWMPNESEEHIEVIPVELAETSPALSSGEEIDQAMLTVTLREKMIAGELAQALGIQPENIRVAGELLAPAFDELPLEAGKMFHIDTKWTADFFIRLSSVYAIDEVGISDVDTLSEFEKARRKFERAAENAQQAIDILRAAQQKALQTGNYNLVRSKQRLLFIAEQRLENALIELKKLEGNEDRGDQAMGVDPVTVILVGIAAFALHHLRKTRSSEWEDLMHDETDEISERMEFGLLSDGIRDELKSGRDGKSDQVMLTPEAKRVSDWVAVLAVEKIKEDARSIKQDIRGDVGRIRGETVEEILRNFLSIVAPVALHGDKGSVYSEEVLKFLEDLARAVFQQAKLVTFALVADDSGDVISAVLAASKGDLSTVRAKVVATVEEEIDFDALFEGAIDYEGRTVDIDRLLTPVNAVIKFVDRKVRNKPGLFDLSRDQEFDLDEIKKYDDQAMLEENPRDSYAILSAMENNVAKFIETGRDKFGENIEDGLIPIWTGGVQIPGVSQAGAVNRMVHQWIVALARDLSLQWSWIEVYDARSRLFPSIVVNASKSGWGKLKRRMRQESFDEERIASKIRDWIQTKMGALELMYGSDFIKPEENVGQLIFEADALREFDFKEGQILGILYDKSDDGLDPHLIYGVFKASVTGSGELDHMVIETEGQERAFYFDTSTLGDQVFAVTILSKGTQFSVSSEENLSQRNVISIAEAMTHPLRMYFSNFERLFRQVEGVGSEVDQDNVEYNFSVVFLQKEIERLSRLPEFQSGIAGKLADQKHAESYSPKTALERLNNMIAIFFFPEEGEGEDFYELVGEVEFRGVQAFYQNIIVSLLVQYIREQFQFKTKIGFRDESVIERYAGFSIHKDPGYLIIAALKILGYDLSSWSAAYVLKHQFADSSMLEASGEDVDQAMSQAPGGIDMNPDQIKWQAERRGEGVQMNFDPTRFENMTIDGFVPVIINVAPLTNIPMLLGIADPEDDQKSSDLGYSKPELANKKDKFELSAI